MKKVDYSDCDNLFQFASQTKIQLSNLYSDFFIENLNVLPKYLKECVSYRELGTNQGGSASIALLQNLPYYELIDKSFSRFNNKKYLFDEYAEKNNIKIIYHETRSLHVETDVKTDFLLVDSIHKYNHVKMEIKKYEPLTNKFIMFHDTNMPPVYQAVTEFVNSSESWVIDYHSDKEGFTVLQKN